MQTLGLTKTLSNCVCVCHSVICLSNPNPSETQWFPCFHALLSSSLLLSETVMVPLYSLTSVCPLSFFLVYLWHFCRQEEGLFALTPLFGVLVLYHLHVSLSVPFINRSFYSFLGFVVILLLFPLPCSGDFVLSLIHSPVFCFLFSSFIILSLRFSSFVASSIIHTSYFWVCHSSTEEILSACHLTPFSPPLLW